MTINLMTYMGIAAFFLSALGATLGLYAFKNRAVYELSYFVESFAVEDGMLNRFGYAFYDMGNAIVEDRSLQFVKISIKNTGNQIITKDLVRKPLRCSEYGLGVEFIKSITNFYTLSSDGTYKNERGDIPIEVKTFQEKKLKTKRMKVPKEVMSNEDFYTVTIADTLAVAEVNFEYLDPSDTIEIEILMTSDHVSEWGMKGKISKVNLKSKGTKTTVYSTKSGFEDPFKVGHPDRIMHIALPPVTSDKDKAK